MEEQLKNAADNEAQIIELKKKINILVKGLKEERKKSSKLEEDNDLLKYELEEKTKLIDKYKNDIDSFSSKKFKENPDKYFQALMNIPEQDSIDEEKHKIIKQNEEYQKNIKKLESEIENLKTKIVELEKNVENLQTQKKDLEEEIKNKEKLYKESNEKYILIMKDLKDDNMITNDYKSKIIKLEDENINLKTNLATLTQQNIFYVQIIEQLKKQIENKGDENYKLEKKIDAIKEIKITDYVFEGILKQVLNQKCNKEFNSVNNISKNKISILFERSTKSISFKVNGNKFVIEISDMKNITYYKKSKIEVAIEFEIDNKIRKIFGIECVNEKDSDSDSDNDKKKINKNIKLVCSFSERECKYIIKFYKEVLNIYEKEQENMLNSVLNYGI